MKLNRFIEEKRKEQAILLMTHLVLGYPSFEDNKKAIEAMVEAGVELIEVQLPFSEPTADGPTIAKANQISIEVNQTKIADCLEFIEEMTQKYPHNAFIVMTYTNIAFRYGFESFIKKAKSIGVDGVILPDLPPHESADYLQACHNNEMAPIYIFTPTHSQERLKELNRISQGMIYAVGRLGVTGRKTNFDQDLDNLIQKYRKNSTLPLALGFGIQDKTQIDFLKNKVDIAVIGSHLINLYREGGKDALKAFLKNLR